MSTACTFKTPSPTVPGSNDMATDMPSFRSRMVHCTASSPSGSTVFSGLPVLTLYLTDSPLCGVTSHTRLVADCARPPSPEVSFRPAPRPAPASPPGMRPRSRTPGQGRAVDAVVAQALGQASYRPRGPPNVEPGASRGPDPCPRRGPGGERPERRRNRGRHVHPAAPGRDSGAHRSRPSRRGTQGRSRAHLLRPDSVSSRRLFAEYPRFCAAANMTSRVRLAQGRPDLPLVEPHASRSSESMAWVHLPLVEPHASRSRVDGVGPPGQRITLVRAFGDVRRSGPCECVHHGEDRPAVRLGAVMAALPRKALAAHRVGEAVPPARPCIDVRRAHVRPRNRWQRQVVERRGLLEDPGVEVGPPGEHVLRLAQHRDERRMHLGPGPRPRSRRRPESESATRAGPSTLCTLIGPPVCICTGARRHAAGAVSRVGSSSGLDPCASPCGASSAPPRAASRPSPLGLPPSSQPLPPCQPVTGQPTAMPPPSGFLRAPRRLESTPRPVASRRPCPHLRPPPSSAPTSRCSATPDPVRPRA